MGVGPAGVLTIAFGLLVLYRPLVGALALVWWLGAYAMAFGVVMMVLGFRLRSFYTHSHHLPPAGRLRGALASASSRRA